MSDSNKKQTKSENKATLLNAETEKSPNDKNLPKGDEGSKKLNAINQAEKVSNINYGREYEKLVNETIRNSFLNKKVEFYFMSNIRTDKINERSFFNTCWKSLQIKQKTKDDSPTRDGKKPKPNEDSLDPFQLNVSKLFGTIQSIELDGAVYIRQSTEKGKDVTIEIEEQKLMFETPCLILIESTIMSDQTKVFEKLIQLLKDFVFARTDSFILNSLIRNPNGVQTDEQTKEVTKAISDLGLENIHVYLLCVTNYQKEEGRKNFDSSWDKIDEIFDLQRLLMLFDSTDMNRLDKENFKKKHVKHIHIQYSPYVDFMSNAKDFQKQIENLGKGVEEMKEQMDKKMKEMSEGIDKKIDQLDQKMDKRMSTIQNILNQLISGKEKNQTQMEEGEEKKED